MPKRVNLTSDPIQTRENEAVNRPCSPGCGRSFESGTAKTRKRRTTS